MKVKVLSRNPSDYMRETKHDIHKLPRNCDPKLHPFEVAREYQRALNAVKIDKMFAKPFVGCLDGHSDIVTCLLRDPTSLSSLISASSDGEIKLWNIPQKKCLRSINAHDGIVRALCAAKNGEYFFSLDSNANIKQWKLNDWSVTIEDDDDEMKSADPNEPLNTIIGKTVTMSMDHHYGLPQIITCGEKVELWEETRPEPLKTYSWGVDSVHCIKFNPVEMDIVCSASSDRSLTLYDTRLSTPIRKVVLELKSNKIAWNPMAAFYFTVANEDYDLYTFDMRNLREAIQIHKDHVGAVIDVDYSPTGKEIVTGSYDKTLRIFKVDEGRSRDVYHTRRMQRLTSVLWSADNNYVLCGSDEMDIRVWKANASQKLGLKSYREEANLRYQEKLKEKYSSHPEVRRIARKRHVPKHVLEATKERRIQMESMKRKEGNRRTHSKPGTVPFVSEKVKHIVKEDE